jgi:hypothetical protein
LKEKLFKYNKFLKVLFEGEFFTDSRFSII